MARPDPWAEGARLLLRHPLPTSVHGDIVAAGTAVTSRGLHPDDNAEVRILVDGHGAYTVPHWWLTIPQHGALRIPRQLLAEVYLSAPRHLEAKLVHHYGQPLIDRCLALTQ